MKKTLPIIIILLVLIAAGIYYSFSTPANGTVFRDEESLPAEVSDSILKTYTDQQTGFTIQYPPEYTAEEGIVPENSEWGTRSIVTISDAPQQGSKPQPVAMTVMVQKQPIGSDGKVHHTIVEYSMSGAAAAMIQGLGNTNGQIVTINGMQALYYYFPPSEFTGIASDTYFFINNDLIYTVGFNPNDPYKNLMLESIEWKR